MISPKFTEQALNYIKHKLAQQKEASVLRVSLQKKGCSGSNYVFNFIPRSEMKTRYPNDLLLHPENAVDVLLDQAHQDFFERATIDCIETRFTKKLHCSSPREGMRCGCGESFEVN